MLRRKRGDGPASRGQESWFSAIRALKAGPRVRGRTPLSPRPLGRDSAFSPHVLTALPILCPLPLSLSLSLSLVLIIELLPFQVPCWVLEKHREDTAPPSKDPWAPGTPRTSVPGQGVLMWLRLHPLPSVTPWPPLWTGLEMLWVRPCRGACTCA